MIDMNDLPPLEPDAAPLTSMLMHPDLAERTSVASKLSPSVKPDRVNAAAVEDWFLQHAAMELGIDVTWSPDATRPAVGELAASVREWYYGPLGDEPAWLTSELTPRT